jgi:hypothetical protein
MLVWGSSIGTIQYLEQQENINTKHHFRSLTILISLLLFPLYHLLRFNDSYPNG